MSGNNGDSGDLRQQAIQDLVDYDLNLDAIGGLVAEAVDTHSRNCFALADDLLSDQSSPRTWIRNGLAAWIQCFETQVQMYRGICSTICRPPDTSKGPVGVVHGGVLTITINVDAENSDPVATNIPALEVSNVNMGGSPLARYIRLSLSPDGKTVLVGLVGLRDGGVFRPGIRKSLQTVLTWNGGSLSVVAKRLPRRPASVG